jgi:hypothetical protein
MAIRVIRIEKDAPLGAVSSDHDGRVDGPISCDTDSGVLADIC